MFWKSFKLAISANVLIFWSVLTAATRASSRSLRREVSSSAFNTAVRETAAASPWDHEQTPAAAGSCGLRPALGPASCGPLLDCQPGDQCVYLVVFSGLGNKVIKISIPLFLVRA